MKPRFLENFPLESRPDALTKLQDATRSFPVAVIAALNQQSTADIIQDDARHAHRVPVALIHRNGAVGERG